ncbi:hypothetical protein F3Y22_tig00113337pilonHSYRG00072 [Hibiscus syriacus]|uniref:RNase H type-1 domain-containing protein n=1 Tax=Hibiscus syriacus TaxID=106335 RepID=A0A6A2WP59_HIBSY|nr:hypothetical protein F3Y22_tig00113337pilonHSYRG00072 [Hibiscus syriacus]
MIMVQLGCVFGSSQRDWIFGSSRSLGKCLILNAELWAIYDALRHAWRLGYRQIELESDNLEAVSGILNPRAKQQRNALFIVIKALLQRDWEVCIRHIRPIHNAVVDRVASLV